MKTIKNKITQIKGEKSFLDYKELIMVVLTNAQDKGFSMNDIILTKKILDVLKTDSENIELEDADYQYLSKKVQGYIWPAFAEDLEGFVNQFKIQQ